MKHPKVSIIVPVYNAGQYLEKCIQSILNQKFQDFELLIINDGSTDTSGSICEKYANLDKRIKYFPTINQGACKARNLGLDKASGEIIWFIDADDTIDDSFLSGLDLDNVSDITFFGFKTIRNGVIKDNVIKTDDTFYHDKSPLTELYQSKETFFGFTWNKLFKKEIIDKYKIRFPENLILHEDMVFTLKYCENIDNIQILSATPYNYLIRSTSLSHRPDGRRNLAEAAEYLDKNIEWSKFPKDLRISLSQTIIKFLIGALSENAHTDKLEDSIRHLQAYYKRFSKDLKVPLKFKMVIYNPLMFLNKFIINKKFPKS